MTFETKAQIVVSHGRRALNKFTDVFFNLFADCRALNKVEIRYLAKNHSCPYGHEKVKTRVF